MSGKWKNNVLKNIMREKEIEERKRREAKMKKVLNNIKSFKSFSKPKQSTQFWRYHGHGPLECSNKLNFTVPKVNLHRTKCPISQNRVQCPIPKASNDYFQRRKTNQIARNKMSQVLQELIRKTPKCNNPPKNIYSDFIKQLISRPVYIRKPTSKAVKKPKGGYIRK